MLNKKEWPLVTVFTLVYNTGKYVLEALESVKANNYPQLQHIIIDDCSTDGVSAKLVQQWIEDNKYPCTFIQHDLNRGICKSLNEILELAEGKYLFGVSDDLIFSDRIFNDVKIFEAIDTSYAVVFSDSKIIDSRGNIISESFLQKIGKREPKSITSGNMFDDLLEGNFIPAMSSTIRLSALKEVGGYNNNLLYEDYDMWLKLSRRYNFFYSPVITSYYRIHGNNLHLKLENKQWENDKLYILLEHKDSPKVKPLIKKQLEILYELGNQDDAERGRKAIEHIGIKLGMTKFFIKNKIPFLVYRPIKFIKNNIEKIFSKK